MGKKKNTRSSKASKHQKRSNNTSQLSFWWQEKRPILSFVLGFAAFMLIYYICVSLDVYKEQIQPPIIGMYSSVSSFFLNILGQETSTQGSYIMSNIFSINIMKGCDAIEPIALFTAAVLAFPASFYHKITGIVCATLFLLLTNIVRLVSLFLTGVYFESIFELMHVEVWQFIFILLSIILCFYWIQWSNKKVVPAV